MTIAIDTNILIYAHIADFNDHAVVRAFLQEQLSQPEAFCLSWQIVYEYLRIVTHPKILKTPMRFQNALKDLEVYLNDPRCQILQETPNHFETLGEIQRKLPSIKANEIHDCHYAAILKENGIKTIVTCDADFLKYDFLQVINPVTAQI